MNLFTLLFCVFSYAHTSDCNLTESFESDFIKVKYSDNWNYFFAGGRHTLMYYEESNFERREHAEITFSYAPAPNKAHLRDTSTLATRYVTAMMAHLKDTLDKKFENARVTVAIENETRVRMANTTWSKVVVNYSGREEDGSIRRANNFFYFNFTEEGTTLIRTNHVYPEIKTVVRDMPCILNSMELKMISRRKG